MDAAAIILVTILTGCTIHYVAFLTRIRIGLRLLRRSVYVSTQPFVSVVIAARNEEHAIGACVQSLSIQSYPSTRYEILIADDGSIDGTIETIRRAASAPVSIQVLPSPDGKPHGKTAALDRAIRQARGEIIVTTDADCIVPSPWLASLVSCFSSDVAFVAGPVVESARGRFFARLEALEFFGLITAGAGLIGSGRPILCNGASMAFRRTAFDAVGGYGEGPDANDDEGLMNKIVHRGFGRAAFAALPAAIVRTHSNNTPWAFFLQRVRWAGKRGRYEDRTILVTLILLYLFFVSLLLTGIVSIWQPMLLLPVGVVAVGKAVIEYLTLRSASRILGVAIPAVPFLIAELFHVPYIVIAAAAGQLTRGQWKA